jgi:RHS repeat-associated protein
VTITAQNTHFVNGSTQASFGPGVAVGSGVAGAFGPVTVTSSTTAMAQLTVSASAPLATRTVGVKTGSEQASLFNGFTVSGSPTILYVSPNYANPGTMVAVSISGLATHFQQGVSVANFGAGISVGGGAMGAAGPITVTGPTAATANLTISAGATLGLRAPVTVTTGTESASWSSPGFFVLGPVTGPFPTVTITSPTEGSQVTTMTTVTGTVSSPNLAYWTLSYEASGSTTFTQFATGTAAAVTGTFDPTPLVNGMAQIQLTGVDQSGQTSSTIVDVVLAGNVKVGNFTLSYRDLSIPVAGIPIQVVRTYDSRIKSSQDFGFGWSLSYNTVTVQINGILGQNWSGTATGGFFPNYCVVPAQNYVVSVRLQDGTVYQFAPQASPSTQCQELVPPEFVDISFKSIGSTPANASLSSPTATGLFVSGGFPGPLQLLDSGTFEPVDPDQYILTLPNGQQLQLSRSVGLQSVTDTNNNTLTFTANGISSSPSGKSVTFARDAQNRITTITDPNGNVLRYAYDASGDLTSVTDPSGNISTFVYDGNHDLLSAVNPLGVQGLRNTYDNNGRLISTTEPNGQTITYAANVSASNELITDLLGNSTLYGYNSNGNLTNVTDPLGNVYTATYDANGNKLSETTPLGQTLSYSYDASNNLLTESGPLGVNFSYTYNSFGQILTVTDPLGKTTAITYDGNGNLLTTTDPLGAVTTTTYNSQGQALTKTDPLGNVTAYQYDTFGNMTQQTDALGNVTTYTYDANGNKLTQSVTRTTSGGTQQTLLTQYQYDASNRLIKTIRPDGTTTQTAYNAIGKPGTVTDGLGHVTQFAYDASGNVTLITFPDGTTQSSTYDAENHKIGSVDQAGRQTTYTYDPFGHLTSTTYPDGSKEQTAYDALGNAVQSIDALGNITTLAYDAAGRISSLTNALSQVTSFAYDSYGNQISRTDANDHTTQYAYDAVGRRITTIYPDGTTATSVYNAGGQVQSATDQNGKITQYAYDPLGRLIKVTDALGEVTTYAYDQVGDEVSQTDANLHTTSYAYDQLGRRISRTLPAAQSESYSYDADSDLVSKTDFNGRTTTYGYDSLNRLMKKTADPYFATNNIGAAQVSFTYTATGKRASMADASGVTSYSYDVRDRVTQKATPFGSLTYAYDGASNESSVQASQSAQAITYSYDSLNRVSTVTDTAGASSYSYDAAGNLIGVNYPNAVQSSYSYDTLNRLTQAESKSGAVSVSNYAYTLDAAGHRLSVTELNGRNVKYAYDSLYRLTSETIAGAASQNGAISYAYDGVGNRLQTTSTVAAVPSGLLNYNADDRLSTDTYDANGATTNSGGVANVYDFENHLVQHGGVTIVYDGDGNRVAKTVSGITTNYLVDTNSLTGYAQVLEELQAGSVVRSYTYGLDLIAEHQSIGGTPTTSFYGYDGHGSVRFLTSSAGAVTDTYDYDAFGNLLDSTGSTPNNFRFAGEQFDPDLNLYYNRARYLNTRTGRFWTMDSVEGSNATPISLHKYLYASANPVSNVDPSGNAFLSNWFYGNLVHTIIGNDYVAATGGCSDAQIIALWAGICGPRIVGLAGADGGVRPDLANPMPGKGDIFEIKPVNSAANAIPQLIFYLGLLSLDLRPNAPIWHVGSAAEFTPPSTIPLNAVTTAFVTPPFFGIIVYYVAGLDDVAAAAAAAALGAEAALGTAAAAAEGLAALARPAIGALVRLAFAAEDLEVGLDVGLAVF